MLEIKRKKKVMGPGKGESGKKGKAGKGFFQCQPSEIDT